MKLFEKATIYLILNPTQQFKKDTGLQQMQQQKLQQQGSCSKSSSSNLFLARRDLAIVVVERRQLKNILGLLGAKTAVARHSRKVFLYHNVHISSVNAFTRSLATVDTNSFDFVGRADLFRLPAH